MPKGDQPSIEELRASEEQADVSPDDLHGDSPQPSVEEQGQQAQQKIKEGTEYPATVDVEWLPSRGLLYNFDGVPFRGLNVREIKYLKSNNSMQGFRNRIREVLQNCTKGIDVNNLTYGDELAFYIRVRVETRDEQFTMKFDCQNQSCGKTNSGYKYDLRTIPLKRLPEDYSEPVKCELAGKEVHFTCLRVRDIKNVETFVDNHVEKYEDKDRAELNMSARQALAMEKVEDVRDTITDKIKFIDNELSANEYLNAVESYMDMITHGIDFEIEVQCRHCNHTFNRQLPFKPELFYPMPNKDSIKDFEIDE